MALEHIGLNSHGNTTPIAFSSPFESSWQAHPHLVVLGIHGTSSALGRVRRNAQRRTWMLSDSVATARNNFTGRMLSLYLHSLDTPYTGTQYVTDDMFGEIREHRDTVMLPLMTLPATNRSLIVPMETRGIETLLLSTRKTVLMLRYFHLAFPLTSFIAKSTDETVINVPELLRTLAQLPRTSTVYGSVRPDQPAVFGTLYALTRDVAWEMATSNPVLALASTPHQLAFRDLYTRYGFDEESLMTGKILEALYTNRTRKSLVGATAPDAHTWGAAYAAHLANPSSATSHGRVDLQGSPGGVAYEFPAAASLRPEFILFVADDCRIVDLCTKDPTTGVGRVAQSGAASYALQQGVLAAMARHNERQDLARPARLTVLPFTSYAYRVQFCGSKGRA